MRQPAVSCSLFSIEATECFQILHNHPVCGHARFVSKHWHSGSDFAWLDHNKAGESGYCHLLGLPLGSKIRANGSRQRFVRNFPSTPQFRKPFSGLVLGSCPPPAVSGKPGGERGGAHLYRRSGAGEHPCGTAGRESYLTPLLSPNYDLAPQPLT